MWKYAVCGILVVIAIILIVWMLVSWFSNSSPKKALEGGAGGLNLVYDRTAEHLQEGQYGVYFSPHCGWCNKLKQDLNALEVSKPVEILMFNVNDSPVNQKDLMKVSPGGGVPCTVQKSGGSVKMVQAGYNADLAKKMTQ